MSFMEGFAGSLGGYFMKRASDDQELASYERKLKMAMDLEKQNKKLLPSGPPKVFQQGGQWMQQSVNEFGEPLGQPTPASEWAKQAAEQAEQDRKITNREREARAATAEMGLELLPQEFADKRRLTDAQIKSYEANAGQSRASAAESGARTQYQLGLNELLKSGQYVPGQRQQAAREDKPEDLQALQDEVAEFMQEDPTQAETIVTKVANGQLSAAQARAEISKLRLLKQMPNKSSIAGQLSDSDFTTLNSRFNPGQ